MDPGLDLVPQNPPLKRKETKDKQWISIGQSGFAMKINGFVMKIYAFVLNINGFD
jgi:hypothetical protein